jgi:hypothetical protein
MLFLFRLGLLTAVLGVVSACDLAPSDDILDGKACDSAGACSKGYTCDVRYNVCRKAGAPQPQCDDAGSCTTAATTSTPGSSTSSAASQ